MADLGQVARQRHHGGHHGEAVLQRHLVRVLRRQKHGESLVALGHGKRQKIGRGGRACVHLVPEENGGSQLRVEEFLIVVLAAGRSQHHGLERHLPQHRCVEDGRVELALVALLHLHALPALLRGESLAQSAHPPSLGHLAERRHDAGQVEGRLADVARDQRLLGHLLVGEHAQLAALSDVGDLVPGSALLLLRLHHPVLVQRRDPLLHLLVLALPPQQTQLREEQLVVEQPALGEGAAHQLLVQRVQVHALLALALARLQHAGAQREQSQPFDERRGADAAQLVLLAQRRDDALELLVAQRAGLHHVVQRVHQHHRVDRLAAVLHEHARDRRRVAAVQRPCLAHEQDARELRPREAVDPSPCEGPPAGDGDVLQREHGPELGEEVEEED